MTPNSNQKSSEPFKVLSNYQQPPQSLLSVLRVQTPAIPNCAPSPKEVSSLMIDDNHSNIPFEDDPAVNHDLSDEAMIPSVIDTLYDLEDNNAVNLHEVLDEIDLIIPSVVDMFNDPKDDN